MKHPIRTLSFCLFLTAFAAVPGVTSSAGPASPVQDKSAEFKTKFKQALSLNNKQEMANLIRQYNDEAVTWIVEVTEATALAPSEQIFIWVEALRNAWKTAKNTDFVSKMERAFMNLDSSEVKERIRLAAVYGRRTDNYFKNLTAKNDAKFGVLALDFKELGDAFESMGDIYFASQCWGFYGQCHDEPNRGTRADLDLATDGYKKCVELRDKIELADNLYNQTKPRVEWLIANGYGSKAGGEEEGGGEGSGPAVVEGTTAIPITGTFEAVKDPTSIRRPSYFLDEIYPMWNAIYLEGKDSVTEFPRLDGVKVIRNGSNSAVIDLDGDGKGDVDIPFKGKILPIEFTLGKGDEARQLAFLTTVGIAKDTYQQIEVNLEPDDNQMAIYIASASSLVGEIEGTPIRVFDDNMDGVYGSPPSTWGHNGMSEEHFQPEMDAIQVAGNKVALPWSEYIKVKDTWYLMEGGSSMTATPVELKTGKVKLKFKGPKPNFLVVQGESTYENAFFDISKGTVEVPVGRYSLFFGEIRSGNKLQTKKAAIIPGANTPKWRVKEGETTTVELGGPFGFDFKFETAKDSITVSGTSVVVTGMAGERYERVWNAVPKPAASYRKAGAKKGTKGKKMRLISSQDDLNTYSWRAIWSPLDVTIHKKPGEDEVEVQLFEKKNKLFGKITSVWRN